MTVAAREPLSDDILLIDTELMRPHHAASYLLVEKGAAAFIEAGTARSVPNLLAALTESGVDRSDVRYVIVTHVHLDHAGGAGALLAHLPNAKLVVHPRGARHMIDPTKLIAGAMQVYGPEAFAAHYDTLVPVPAARILEATDNLVLDLQGRRLTFFDTPGHARHHVCVHDERSNTFFTGDTFGIAYRQLTTPRGPFIFPTTTPVQFDPRHMHTSIDRLLAQSPKAMHLTHYGRVDRPHELGPRLHSLIDQMAAVATQAPHGASRTAHIQEGVAAVMTDAYRALGGVMSEDLLRSELFIDVLLNAQGLEVWLDQKAPS